MITAQEYQQAERDLAGRECRREWRVHAAVYAAVVTALSALNIVIIATTTDDFVWFPFPLIGWGFGLTMHYLFGVKWGDRELRARQARIEQYAREPVLTP